VRFLWRPIRSSPGGAGETRRRKNYSRTKGRSTLQKKEKPRRGGLNIGREGRKTGISLFLKRLAAGIKTPKQKRCERERSVRSVKSGRDFYNNDQGEKGKKRNAREEDGRKMSQKKAESGQRSCRSWTRNGDEVGNSSRKGKVLSRKRGSEKALAKEKEQRCQCRSTRAEAGPTGDWNGNPGTQNKPFTGKSLIGGESRLVEDAGKRRTGLLSRERKETRPSPHDLHQNILKR